jgi:hypothetical protein
MAANVQRCKAFISTPDSSTWFVAAQHAKRVPGLYTFALRFKAV